MQSEGKYPTNRVSGAGNLTANPTYRDLTDCQNQVCFFAAFEQIAATVVPVGLYSDFGF